VVDQDLDAKRLQLLKEALPGVSLVAVSYNPVSSHHTIQLSRMEAVAPTLEIGVRRVALAATAEDVQRTFAAVRRTRVGALRVQSDPVTDQ
jgi:hypothetical protein